MLVEIIPTLPPMLSIFGAIVGAIAGAGASLGASAISYKIAKENRQFQKRMSNTAYQRGMRDMRKAGLNPILAYQKGGASTPAGSISTVQDPTSSAKEGAMVGAQVSLLKQQQATSAEQAKTIAQTRINKKPSEEYQGTKDSIKLNLLKAGQTSARSLAPKGFLSIVPDFGNFLDRKNPKGSYVERLKRSKSATSKKRRNAPMQRKP